MDGVRVRFGAVGNRFFLELEWNWFGGFEIGIGIGKSFLVDRFLFGKFAGREGLDIAWFDLVLAHF